jgi:hypothetical protein
MPLYERVPVVEIAEQETGDRITALTVQGDIGSRLITGEVVHTAIGIERVGSVQLITEIEAEREIVITLDPGNGIVEALAVVNVSVVVGAPQVRNTFPYTHNRKLRSSESGEAKPGVPVKAPGSRVERSQRVVLTVGTVVAEGEVVQQGGSDDEIPAGSPVMGDEIL